MTVRSWITISVAVLVALVVAVVIRFTTPIKPPVIVVRADGNQIEGVLRAGCWPQRSGKLRCNGSEDEPTVESIDSNGSLRFVLASPAQPKDGEITMTDGDGKVALKTEWKRTVRYDLEPGRYTLRAFAGDRTGPYVDYVFAVRLTRDGS